MHHSCPHCSSDLPEDGFEVLDEGVLHECKCEHCSKVYYLYFVECPHCVNDSVFTWATKPSAEGLTLLSCEFCGHKLSADETLEHAST